jgi:hypothetical protein
MVETYLAPIDYKADFASPSSRAFEQGAGYRLVPIPLTLMAGLSSRRLKRRVAEGRVASVFFFFFFFFFVVVVVGILFAILLR